MASHSLPDLPRFLTPMAEASYRQRLPLRKTFFSVGQRTAQSPTLPQQSRPSSRSRLHGSSEEQAAQRLSAGPLARPAASLGTPRATFSALRAAQDLRIFRQRPDLLVIGQHAQHQPLRLLPPSAYAAPGKYRAGPSGDSPRGTPAPGWTPVTLPSGLAAATRPGLGGRPARARQHRSAAGGFRPPLAVNCSL